MSHLERSQIGAFHLRDAIPLDQLQAVPLEELASPPQMAVAHLAQYHCSAADRQEIIHGRSILLKDGTHPPQDSENKDPLALLDSNSRLIALADYDQQSLCLRPKHVFISTNRCD